MTTSQLDLVSEVEALLNAKGIRSGTSVVVAVSGGLDSMALLDVLRRLKSPELRLAVAHFDHRLRPESGDDAAFVESEVRLMQLAFTKGHGDVGIYARAHHLSVEMAARHLRYRFLNRVLRETRADYLALGHHADDQAETVLLRMLRGSVSGLGGMSEVRDDCYLRPLLRFTKASLEGYAACRGVRYRDDATNTDQRHLRNRVRHSLLPHLREEFNPNIVATLQRTANVLKDEDAWLDTAVGRVLPETLLYRASDCIELAAPCLRSYHIAIQRRVLRHFLHQLCASEGHFEQSMVDVVLRLMAPGGKRIADVGAGVRAQHADGRLILRRGTAAAFERPLVIPGTTPIPERSLTARARYLPVAAFEQIRPVLGSWQAAFDADSLANEALRVRPWRRGDRLQPFGLGGGHKTVSDLLIDAKVPRLQREELIVLTQRGEVLWALGIRAGNKHRVAATTRHFLHLRFDRT